MKKVIGILVVVLTVLGLGGIWNTKVESVSANEATGDKLENEVGEVYYETIDISGYTSNGTQVIVDEGMITGARYVQEDGTKVKSPGEYPTKSLIVIRGGNVWRTGMLELEITSYEGRPSIKINDGLTPETSIDYAYVDVSDGRELSVDYRKTARKTSYLKFKAEEGKRYLYDTWNQSTYEIISPSGRTVEKHQEYTFAGAITATRSKVFEPEETGVYMVKSSGLVVSANVRFNMYELFENVEDVGEINLSDSGGGRYTYAVEAQENTVYSFKSPTEEEDYSGVLRLNVADMYREPIRDNLNPYYFRERTTTPEVIKTQRPYLYLRNTKGNKDTYAHKHTWTKVDEENVSVRGKSHTIKTGDSAKEKVKELKSEDRESSMVADPIDSFAGNFVDERSLLTYSGNNPLEFKLSYDSIANESKSLGGGFTHNFETYLDIHDEGVNIYWTPNSVVKAKLQDGEYIVENKNQIGVTIEKTEEGYLVKDKNQNKYSFNDDGLLIIKEDKVGLITYLTRDSEGNVTKIHNDKGQEFNLIYTEDKLSQVTDKVGRELNFNYMGNGNLQNIELPNKDLFEVSYTTTGKVSQLKQGNSVIVKNTYDSNGRVSIQYDGNNNRTNFGYDEYTNDEEVKTTITTGKVEDVKIHDIQGNLIREVDGLGNTTNYEYDENRNLIHKIDKNGNEHNYQYDTSNRLIKEINPTGLEVNYEYDSNNNITKLTDVDGKTVINEYENNRLVKMTDKLGNEVNYTYDVFGNVEKIIRDNYFVENTYDTNGNIKTVTQDDILTEYETDELGRIIETKLSDGKSIKNEYDISGNIIKTTDLSGNETEYTYNTFGDKLKEVNSDNIEVNYTYDGNGNLKSETQEDRVLTYTYNAFNLITKKVNGTGYNAQDTETYTYNNRNELVTYSDADKKTVKYTYGNNGNLLTEEVGTSVTTYGYDANDYLISQTDPNGNITTYENDVNGDIIKQISANGTEEKYEYDSMGRVLSLTDSKGKKTEYTYDERGNVLTLLESNNAKTQYKYNSLNQVIEETNALGEITKYNYNSLGQLESVINPLGETIVSYTYDSNGNMSTITNGNSEAYTFKYDSRNNLIEVYDALNNLIETNEYSNFNELIKVTDALNHTNSFIYNKYGNMTEEVNTKEISQTYTYSKASRLTRTTNVNGTTADYGYDKYGNTSVIGQASYSRTVYTRDENQNIIKDTSRIGNTQYTYDSVNNLVKKINARNQTINYEYDTNNNLTKEITPENPEGTIIEYDTVGNIILLQDKTSKIEREYDLLGRVTSKTQNGEKVSYKYDARGHLTELTYPNGNKVKYTYDLVGNMLSVTDWNNKETKYEYDKNGRLVKTINSNGIIEDREYDVKGQLTKLERTKEEEVLDSTNYTYDSEGNVITENDRAYNYDTLNRLISTNTSNYAYTGFGNISEFNTNLDSESYNQKMSYGYDNELKSINSKAVQVDKDGNLLTYTLNGVKYAADYDSQNNLLSFDGINYEYDSEGNRIKVSEGSKETTFVVDTDNPNSKYSQILTEETDGKVKYHIYGNGLIGTYENESESEVDSESFLTNHYDLRGSTVSISDTEGKIVGTVDYDEYGVILHQDKSIETRFLYNGQYGVQTDDNGLNYMRNRYYNPEIKRFMNRDVIVGNIEDSQTLNRYAYVNGNPITYNDPFGLARESISDSGWLSNLQTTLDIAGMVPGLGVFPDVINAGIYLASGNYEEALWSGVGAIPIVGDATSGVRNVSKLSKTVKDVGKPNPLRKNEGRVGKYGDFSGKKFKGDNLTAHHMPSSQYMRLKCGVSNSKGVCMMMDQPHPGKGGRHRETFTYGRLSKEKKEEYLNKTPREALANDILDARKIYMKDGLYTKEIKRGLLNVIKENKKEYPEHFGK